MQVRDGHDEVERIARESYGRLVAMVARRTRDLSAAEDAIGEGFRRALETWPREGVPAQPEAWIVTVARRAAIDQGRRAGRERGLQEQVEAVLEEIAAGRGKIADERLELMLLCAHPALDAAVRTPLILQCVLGLDAARIAAAYVVPAATMSQRLVRAKVKIRDAGLRFGIPEDHEWGARLGAVLDAVYVAFTCGWEADDGVTGGG